MSIEECNRVFISYENDRQGKRFQICAYWTSDRLKLCREERERLVDEQQLNDLSLDALAIVGQPLSNPDYTRWADG